MLKKVAPITCLFLLLSVTFFLQSCRTDPKVSTTEEVIPSGPLTVTSRLRGEPDKLKPYFTLRGYSRYAFRDIFPTLVEFDPKEIALKPMLAKALPTVEPITSGEYAGGVAYTMEIHEGAVWDNGSPVQASDYIFTLKMIDNPAITGATVAYRDVFGFIRDVEIDPNNPKKFTVLTDKPYFQGEYAVGLLWVYPEYVYDAKGLLKDFALKDLSDPAKAATLVEKDPRLTEYAEEIMDPKYSNQKGFISSCGAYAFEEWIPGQKIVLKKKKDWWGEKLMKDYPLLSAYPDELVFKIVPDQNAAITMAKEGQLDILSAIPANNFLELKNNELIKENYNFFTPMTNSYNYIGVNNKSPKLNDKRIRRALAHLLDVETIKNTVWQGFAEKTSNPIIPSYSFYDKSLQIIEYNVEKAKALLAEAGWKDTNGNGTADKKINGKLTELNLEYLISPGNTVSNNAALIFKEAANKAGVNIEITTKEVNQIFDQKAKGNFELFSAAAGLDVVYYDPYQLWHTSSTSNYVGFGNASTDALIDEIRITLDEKKRDVLYKELQQILYDEQPIIMINVARDRIIINKRLKNAFATILSPGYYEHYFHY